MRRRLTFRLCRSQIEPPTDFGFGTQHPLLNIRAVRRRILAFAETNGEAARCGFGTQHPLLNIRAVRRQILAFAEMSGHIAAHCQPLLLYQLSYPATALLRGADTKRVHAHSG